MKPALIIGSTCVDVIINIDHLPKTAENIHPGSQSLALGGCAYNVSYIMRLLGADHTFITPVGGGVYGDYIAKEMTALGIPLSVYLPEKENGCCYCLVEADGERTFMSYHGVEYTFQKSWMTSYPAEQYGLTYICGLEVEEPTGAELVEYLEQNRKLQVFYAPGPRGIFIEPAKHKRMLALNPILHINEQESLALSGCSDFKTAATYLQAITHNTIIITLGAEGTYCLEQDGTAYTIPGVQAETVVDTIGAGDSHAGTIIAYLTKDIPLNTAVTYANSVAAAVVGTKGASLSPDQLPKQ